MRAQLYRLLTSNRVILTNATSLMSTTIATSVLGFVYWWLAARQFSPQSVGLASTAISAMMLLGALGKFGLGTMLIGELPRHPGKERSLIATALSAAGIAGCVLGMLFAILAPLISIELRPLAESFWSIALFALGVGVTAVTLVLDRALIGLLRGRLQFSRNLLFGVVKLAALLVVAVWWSNGSGLAIYATWFLGNVLSLVALAKYALLPGTPWRACRPQWGLLRRVRRAAIAHQQLNLALQSVSFGLPLVVTVVLSATMNAYFYTAWMLVGFVFAGIGALTTMLYALGAADPTALAQKTRFTLGLAFAAVLLMNAVLLAGADPMLRLFGGVYAEQAAWPLRILGLGVFPLIIREHYVAIYRVHRRATSATLPVALGSLLKLLMAGIGAHIGGLVGLSLGVLAAACIEALFMAPAVYRVAVDARMPRLRRVAELCPRTSE